MPDVNTFGLFERVKLALRISTEKFDADIQDLIEAALADLLLTDIAMASEDDPLIRRAVITYARAHFGTPEPAEYKRLKEAYDEQKAQLLMHSSYTDWGDES